MADMDPAVCMTTDLYCVDYTSSIDHSAPKKDSESGGENDLCFDFESSSFKHSTASFVFKRPFE